MFLFFVFKHLKPFCADCHNTYVQGKLISHNFNCFGQSDLEIQRQDTEEEMQRQGERYRGIAREAKESEYRQRQNHKDRDSWRITRRKVKWK